MSDKKVFQSIINIFFCNKWMFSISRGRILLKIIASGRLLKIRSLLIMNPDWLPQAPSKYNSHRRAIVPRLDCTSARLYLDEKCTSTGLPLADPCCSKSKKMSATKLKYFQSRQKFRKIDKKSNKKRVKPYICLKSRIR